MKWLILLIFYSFKNQSYIKNKIKNLESEIKNLKNKKKEEKNVCLVCMDELSNHANVVCGHMCYY